MNIKMLMHHIFVSLILCLLGIKLEGGPVDNRLTALPMRLWECPICTNQMESFQIECFPKASGVNGELPLMDLLCEDIDRKLSEDSEYVVIADVVAVTPIAIVGFDTHYRLDFGIRPEVWYRVEVRVRKSVKGELRLRSFSFPVKYDDYSARIPGGWLFYRGITLQLELRRNGERTIVLNKVNLSLPDAPYGGNGVSVVRTKRYVPSRWLTAFDDKCDDNGVFLYVFYGEDVCVRYGGGEMMIGGKTFSVQDFGFSSRIDVAIRKGGTGKEGWLSRWFAGEAVFSVVEVDLEE